MSLHGFDRVLLMCCDQIHSEHVITNHNTATRLHEQLNLDANSFCGLRKKREQCTVAQRYRWKVGRKPCNDSLVLFSWLNFIYFVMKRLLLQSKYCVSRNWVLSDCYIQLGLVLAICITQLLLYWHHGGVPWCHQNASTKYDSMPKLDRG